MTRICDRMYHIPSTLQPYEKYTQYMVHATSRSATVKKRYTTSERCYATKADGNQCGRRALIGGRGLCSNHVLTDEQWARVDRLLEKQQEQDTYTEYRLEKDPQPMT